MSSIETEYNNLIAGAKEASASEREQLERVTGFLPGVNWKFGTMPTSGRPIIQVACSECRTTFFTELLEFKWKHCGVTSVCPPELSEKLKKAQIKRGTRKTDNFVSRLLGKEPAPALNNF